MKDSNLQGEILRQSFLSNIHTVLELSKEPSVIIKFRFIDTKLDFTVTIKFDCFAHMVRLKGVFLGTLSDLNCQLLMVENMKFDCFSYVDIVEHHTPSTCHGHGEYWGEDEFVFVYKRFHNE